MVKCVSKLNSESTLSASATLESKGNAKLIEGSFFSLGFPSSISPLLVSSISLRIQAPWLDFSSVSVDPSIRQWLSTSSVLVLLCDIRTDGVSGRDLSDGCSSFLGLASPSCSASCLH